MWKFNLKGIKVKTIPRISYPGSKAFTTPGFVHPRLPYPGGLISLCQWPLRNRLWGLFYSCLLNWFPTQENLLELFTKKNEKIVRASMGGGLPFLVFFVVLIVPSSFPLKYSFLFLQLTLWNQAPLLFFVTQRLTCLKGLWGLLLTNGAALRSLSQKSS